jgi:hypothetical protein
MNNANAQSATTARCPIHRASVSRDEWAFAKRTTLLLLALVIPALKGQTAPCGITSVKDVKPPIYPPLAKAAHVSGTVIVMTQFALSGNVINAQILSGPNLLRQAAIDSVAALRVNQYGGSRECPVVIAFLIAKEGEYQCDDKQIPAGILHIEVCAASIALTDESPTLKRKK